MPATAEALNSYPGEQTFQPHLRLVPNESVTVEAPITPEDELARRRSAQFKGHVAVEALQAEYDACTEFAELVDGQMRTSLELSFDGHDLYGPDGRSMTETGKKGLKAAREQAKKNPNMWFEVGRRSLELEEIVQGVEMIKTYFATGGNAPNTQLVTTDYPSILRGAQEDVGGYNHMRQQALARSITVNSDNKIFLHSQTLDGSNRQALDAVHADFGFQTEPGELLGQRRTMKLTAEDQATMMDRTTNVYDREMAVQFGGEWYAGRRPVDYRNTYDFVCSQRDLVELYIDLKLSGGLTGSAMYDLAATMNSRFRKDKASRAEAARQTHAEPIITAPSFARESALGAEERLHHEVAREGQAAREQGKTFSACGSTWRPEGIDSSTGALLKDAGYSTETGTETSWHGGKIYKNEKCQSCKEVKAEVGACRICRDCVEHPKKGRLETVQGRTADPQKAKVNKEPAKVISLEAVRQAKEKGKIQE